MCGGKIMPYVSVIVYLHYISVHTYIFICTMYVCICTCLQEDTGVAQALRFKKQVQPVFHEAAFAVLNFMPASMCIYYCNKDPSQDTCEALASCLKAQKYHWKNVQ